MLGNGEDADLAHRLDAIQARVDASPDAIAIAAVVESVLSSLSGDVTVESLRLYRELEELQHFIQGVKREIAAVEPHTIRERDIPMANDELDAVLEHTAEATGTILDVAETIERLTPAMAKDTGAVAADCVTRIYEACNFQDITGQRITKVVQALKHIEAKIDALLEAFGDRVAAARPAPVSAPSEAQSLMNGPQLPANANKQADIDAILASLE